MLFYNGEINMEEINLNLEKKKNQKNWIIALIVFVMSIFYGASPIDLIPDIIPILGWTDDSILFILAAINLYKKWKTKNKTNTT
jgi:uncharacterized membrane protein YkvA (DUF1232 family)